MISADYSALLTEKHSTDAEWGASGPKFADRVIPLIMQTESGTVIDYGCGKGALADVINSQLGLEPVLYDPGIPAHANPPKDPADIVICTDVLEHVEPELLDNVLEHIAHLTKKAAYLIIHTGDCGHKLPDGRAAHLIQQPRGWWEAVLLESSFAEYFEFSFSPTDNPNRFEVIMTRRTEPMSDDERQTRAEILEGLKDPEPDLSAIDEVDSKVDMPKGGMFGGLYREEG